ncbi:heme-degrading domain-containing protein [Arthrobacter bussei]|uniref:Heme-degrading domain-containing protein n=1 Tax=Arthrobacter bussei TaxID=2594179 RepID=A0A7X1NSL7_9MICC|nr:heme-degrading domain-containing protein [Arthrobacter bussei]MPY12065.1 heme-degrading domain-containing protein [Arthrobacter bussei]
MSNDAPSTVLRPFDPDGGGDQPVDALEALIAKVEGEVAELQFTRFTNDDAVALGQLLVQMGVGRNLPIAIGISKPNHILFRAALDGATPDNDFWLDAKSRTAARYLVPSLLVGLRARRNGGRFEGNPMVDQSTYAAHGGSFPLYIRGVGPVATVTVSGLPQLEDHKLVVEALRTFHAADGL